MGPEVYIDHAALAALFGGAKEELKRRTAAIRQRQVEQLTERAAKAIKGGRIDAEQLQRLLTASPPLKDKLAIAVRSVFRDWYEAGRKMVREERERQLADTKLASPTVIGWAAKASIDAVTSGLKDAATDRQRLAALEASGMTDEQAREWLAMYAVVNAELITRSTAWGIAASTMEYLRGAPPTTEFSKYVSSNGVVTSDQTTLQAGGAVSRLTNLGRNTQAFDYKDQITYGIYSALQDPNTCRVCKDYDNRVYSDMFEADALVPNVSCEGTEARCRCVICFVYGMEPPVADGEKFPETYPDWTARSPAAVPAPGGYGRKLESLRDDVPTFETHQHAEDWAYQTLGVKCAFATDPNSINAANAIPLPLAQRTVERLQEMKTEGFLLPRGIALDYIPGHPSGVAYYDEALDSVVFNTGSTIVQAWATADTSALDALLDSSYGWWTTKGALHALDHELGHMNNGKTNHAMYELLGLTYRRNPATGQLDPMGWSPKNKWYRGKGPIVEVAPHLSPPIEMGDFDVFKGWSKAELDAAAKLYNTFENGKPLHVEVSGYGISHPLEFVAETYAGLLSGVTYSPTVLFWYKHFGGRMPK